MNTKFLAGLGVALFLFATVSTLGAAAAATPTSIYTMDNAAANSVLQFQTTAGGGLALSGTFSTHGSGTGSALTSQGSLTFTDDGHWLIAVDAGSDQVTVFGVDSNGGLDFSSIAASHGTDPISVTVSNGLVYVLNAGSATVAGNIAGFTLGNSQLNFIAGSVRPLGGAAGSSPEQIGFSKGGDVLVVTEKAANIIDTYTVGKDGIATGPTTTASNSGGPYGFAFTPKGTLVLSEAATGTLSSYAVSRDGSLTTISDSVPDFGLAPCWLAITHDGRYAFASNAHGGTISTYSISGKGVLTLESSVSATDNIPTLDLAVSGHHLFALNGGSISEFRIGNDGSLHLVSSIGGIASSAAGLATA